jgi:hypothetical protein
MWQLFRQFAGLLDVVSVSVAAPRPVVRRSAWIWLRDRLTIGRQNVTDDQRLRLWLSCLESAHIFANSPLGGSLGAAMLRVGDGANVLLVSSPPG